MTREKQERLSEDIHLLGDILGHVIRRQAGIEIFELEERIRALAKTRRLEDDPAIDTRLAYVVGRLDPAEAELVARHQVAEGSHALLRTIQAAPKHQLERCLARHRQAAPADA